MEMKFDINQNIKIVIKITKRAYKIYQITIIDSSRQTPNCCKSIVVDNEYDYKQITQLLSFIYNVPICG